MTGMIKLQLCDSVVCCVECGFWSSAFFICSSLTWVVSKFLIAFTGCLYPYWLSALSTAWLWLTAACHWRQNLSCGPIFQGGWVKAPCLEAWATLPRWNSGNYFTYSFITFSITISPPPAGHKIKTQPKKCDLIILAAHSSLSCYFWYHSGWSLFYSITVIKCNFWK